jgi:hypothetical protein
VHRKNEECIPDFTRNVNRPRGGSGYRQDVDIKRSTPEIFCEVVLQS